MTLVVIWTYRISYFKFRIFVLISFHLCLLENNNKYLKFDTSELMSYQGQNRIKQYGKNKHYPIFSLSKDLSICFWVWNIKKSNMLCIQLFSILSVLQNMGFQFQHAVEKFHIFFLLVAYIFFANCKTVSFCRADKKDLWGRKLYIPMQ